MADGYAPIERHTRRSKHRLRPPARIVPDDPVARARAAEEDLANARPDASAKFGLTRLQRYAFIGLAALILLGLILWPEEAVSVLRASLFLVFLGVAGFRAVIMGIGVRAHYAKRAEPALPKGATLPVYPVLIPLFKEARAVPGLVASLKQLSYPKSRLDVIFLVEACDPDTLAALEATDTKGQFRIAIVPEGAPRTKPRALNYGLGFARGEYVTVYDAEDRPHPFQLKAALAAFQEDREKTLACVQAPLRAQNDDESWIASQWALEYAVQFRLLLRGLALCRLPMMLGGTSNHFRRDALEAVGGWDPYNVTEDADLGLRFERLDLRLGWIAPETLEEAPLRFRPWWGQRSRWIKGYIQTLLVLLRDPAARLNEMGLARFLAAQALLTGSILSASLHGLFWLIGVPLLWIAGQSLSLHELGLLLGAYAANIGFGLVAYGRLSRARVVTLLTFPLYWPLATASAVRAYWEMVRNPHFWAKTDHGLSRKAVTRSVRAFAE